MPPDQPREEPSRRPETSDRRRRDLPFWHPRRLHGRRMRKRRALEDDIPHTVDRVTGGVFAMAVLILLLTIVDGVFTVALLDAGCEELNPAMRLLLERSASAFFMGKYVLTALFLPVALVMNRYRLFGTRIRVGHLMPVLVVLYVSLIVYQIDLWRRTRPAAVSHARAERIPASAPGAGAAPIFRGGVS